MAQRWLGVILGTNASVSALLFVCSFGRKIGALLYKIIDFTESEVNEIPPDLTCNERPQQWQKPCSNSSKDELVLLDELLVIKHNYEADKTRKKNVVRTQRKVKKHYDAAPFLLVKSMNIK